MDKEILFDSQRQIITIYYEFIFNFTNRFFIFFYSFFFFTENLLTYKFEFFRTYIQLNQIQTRFFLLYFVKTEKRKQTDTLHLESCCNTIPLPLFLPYRLALHVRDRNKKIYIERERQREREADNVLF